MTANVFSFFPYENKGFVFLNTCIELLVTIEKRRVSLFRYDYRRGRRGDKHSNVFFYDIILLVLVLALNCTNL